MFKTKLKFIFLSLLLAVQMVASPAAMAAFLNIRAYGTDTVAGYASLLKSSMLKPGKSVIFVVEKPDYSVVRIPAQADMEGIAKADLYGHQTKLAGVYKVAINYPGTADASPQNAFTVYPDQVSKTQSVTTSTTQMLEADGLTNTFLTVTLYDAYRNPIKDHQIKLISSRTEDVIQAMEGGITNEEGKANFKVSSKYDGFSIFTAMDASSNTVLDEREEIVFFKPTAKEIGGNYFSSGALSANILNDQNVLPGPVSKFEVEGLPSSVKVNTDLTMSVVAKDKNGNIAKNYTGTILISTPSDENAVLPNNGEYTFKEADQGKFTFNLALRFSQLGKQTIQILDKSDWKIAGEFSLDVVSSQVVNQAGNSSSLSIKAPPDGADFGTNLVSITGQGEPNVNIKVFDDDVKIADTQTDSDGFFNFQASGLSGGTHTFYVMGDGGQVSNSVTVNIDTIPPVLNSLQITPDGPVNPGQNVNLILNSEPNLAEVKIRVQGVEKTLSPAPGQLGSYTVSLVAPALAGTFPVDVILVDELSNRSELLNQKSLVVQGQVAASNAPTQVQNVEAVSGNGEVLLTWDPVTGNTAGITSYKVYYGLAYTALTEILQTQGADTSIKVPNLENERQYFFAITAVDTKGLESKEKSSVLAVTPLSDSAAPEGEIEEEPLQEEIIDPVQEEIPNQAPKASLYNNPLNGIPSNGAVTLSWEPFPGVKAAGYKAYFGLNSGQYDDYVLTPGNQTTIMIRDLINSIPYYFAVVAIDASGKEISPLSAQFTTVPSGTAFHSASADQIIPSRPGYVSPLSNFQLSKVPSQSENGTAALWLVIFSVVTAGGFYFYKRKIFA